MIKMVLQYAGFILSNGRCTNTHTHTCGCGPLVSECGMDGAKRRAVRRALDPKGREEVEIEESTFTYAYFPPGPGARQRD